MSSLALSFNEVKFNPVVQSDSQIYLTASELAQALDYKSVKSVSNLYNSNKDEFTASMSLVMESMTNGINNSKRKLNVRIFSLRGCHLIAFFARTSVAKAFRKWVLDILHKEVGTPLAKTHKSERTALHDARAAYAFDNREGMRMPNFAFKTNIAILKLTRAMVLRGPENRKIISDNLKTASYTEGNQYYGSVWFHPLSDSGQLAGALQLSRKK